MQSFSLILIIITTFFIVFPLLWMGIVFMISFMSGWQSLAQRYATIIEAPTNTRSMASGMVGFSRYNNVLKVGLSDRGIYLSVFILFRPGHKPLFVPWSDISEVRQVDYFFRKMYNIKIGSPRIATLKLPVSYFEGWETYLENKH